MNSNQDEMQAGFQTHEYHSFQQLRGKKRLQGAGKSLLVRVIFATSKFAGCSVAHPITKNTTAIDSLDFYSEHRMDNAGRTA